MKINEYWLLTLIGVILFFVIWEISSIMLSSIYFPQPLSIVSRFYQMVVNGTLTPDIFASMERLLLGFGLAVVVGIPLGIVTGVSRRTQILLSPTIELFRYISPIALFPLFILIFGIGLSSKVVMIFWVAWAPILINTTQGIKNVNPVLIKAAKSLGAKPLTIVSKVMIPSATPYIISGLRVGIGVSFLALVAAEMIGANSGLGFLVLQSAESFHLLNMYVGIMTLSILGFLSNYAFLLLEKRFKRYMA